MAEAEPIYERTTRAIRILVRPRFLDHQSRPDDNHFVWAYTVRIENRGTETVTLRTRHWHITDGLGRKQDVNGPGVVGEQPKLGPGQSFEYTSGVPLSTPSGIMEGRYRLEREQGGFFDVMIPAFSLDSPHMLRQIN